MLKVDIDLFTKKETTELDDSFSAHGLSWRSGQTIVGGLLTVAVALTLYFLDVPRIALVATMILYALVFTVEKLSYRSALVSSRSTVQKLVRREDLEGVAQTPDDVQPSLRTSVIGRAPDAYPLPNRP